MADQGAKDASGWIDARVGRAAVSALAQRLAESYYSFLVSQHVARNANAINLLPPAIDGDPPIGHLPRKDGYSHTLDLRHYLDRLRTDQRLQTEITQAWATGAIAALADALAAFDYFDHAPELELVYHLRNGLAHGNRFNLTPQGLRRLSKHPAHNREAMIRSPAGTVYEIIPGLEGEVLYGFMGPGDVVDLLQSVGMGLMRLR